MQTLRKILAISVIFVTVLSMSVVVAPKAQAAASAGDLIKMSGLSSVYYLGADNKRYVFPNESTYFSWYSDFSAVVTVPQSELEALPLGKNVTVRPGTKLVKITTNPNVYAVTPGGVLVRLPSEAVASTLYGANWAKRVIDVSDAFFTNYSISSIDATATAYPEGSLIKTATDPNIYLVNGGGVARKIASEGAFNANRFKWSDVITTTLSIPTLGTEITAAESSLTDTASGAGGVIPTGGSGLTVSLSGITASSATIVAGQNIADLASFNFTAANDGAVKVTSVKIKKTGIASDSSLSNVYLFMGNARISDAGSLSSGVATFSNGQGLFTVPAGQTVTVSVKASVSGGVSGQTVGASINAATDVTTGGAVVSGSFPVVGNQMSIATVSSPALSVVTASAVTPSGANIQAGTLQATVFNSSFNVTTKAATLKYIRFAEVGSAQVDAFANINLFVNGVQAGTAGTIDSYGNVAFDLSAAPVTLNTGANTVEVRADIVKGSSRTFAFNLQDQADVVVVDGNYSVALVLVGVPATEVANTISAGSVSVSIDPNFTASQVVKGTAGATIAKYTMKAFGEDMKVQTLNVIPTVTASAGNFVQATEGLSNISLFVNGSQVGSSKNMIAATGTSATLSATQTFGSTNLFTIPAGTTVTLEVKADLTQLNPTYFSTVKAQLQAAAGAYIGVSSVATSGGVTYSAGPSLSVINGALAVSKNTAYGSQVVLANTPTTKIGSYVLQAGTAEAVRITNVKITLSGTAALTDLSNLYTSVNTTPVTAQTDNNFPVNITLPAGGTQAVDVFADLGNIHAASTTITSITVIATGVSTGNSVGNVNPLVGQTLTVQAGQIAGPTLVTNAPSAQLVTPGAALAATYKFVATNGAATISELVFNVVGNATTSSSTAISSVTVGGNTAQVIFDAVSGNMVADVAGLNIVVPAGSTGLSIPVSVVYNPVTSATQGGQTSRTQVGLNLVAYKSTIGNTTATTPVDVASKVMVLVASNMLVTKDALVSSGTLPSPGGVTTVAKFSVTAGAAGVNLKQISVTPSISGTLTGTALKIYDASDMSTLLGTGTMVAGLPAAANVQRVIIFDNDFAIGANQTKQFAITADTTGLSNTGNSFRLDLTAANDTAVDTTNDWKWNDTTVNAGTYGNGYLVKNLAITGDTLKN